MTTGSRLRILLVFVLLLSGLSCSRFQSDDIPSFGKDEKSESEYYAVLLTNGQVYFGKLHDLGSSHPVITDVYYVQTTEDPITKRPTSVLVKRGGEWHAPSRTILNASQILLIEPVAKNSKVRQLIEEQQKAQAAQPGTP
ncbi:MAG: hypothetical protein HY234_14855 [Acidobacteria bacterium]|nr:hypothetical protein [Acidobacteriota bacterium]